MESVLTSPTSIAHIVLVYALVISVGLALGRIKVFGVSLGVTFVLFVGLAAGHFGMAIEPHVLTFLRDFGLILFIFFIGLQVGPSFFSSFKSGGIILNGLAAGAIVLSILVTILLWALTAGLIDLPTMLGVHFGAVTNTPGLGATQEALAVMGWQGADIAVACLRLSARRRRHYCFRHHYPHHLPRESRRRRQSLGSRRSGQK